jgi:hypothetical protein
MKRREIIALLAGAAVGLPLATRGQSDATRRIGALIAFAKDDPETEERLAGRNVCFSPENCFNLSSERIRAKLESNSTRAITSAAFEMKHRPGAVGGPQSMGLPIRTGSIGATIDVLREKAHRIRNREVDQGAVHQGEYCAV